jgi:endonuclease YncB( thermonuclease family)
MKKMFLILMAALAFCAAHAQAQQYRVVCVMDGDTVKVLSNDRQQMKCRLDGIDALWADPSPTPPWDFRRNEKSTRFREH